MSEYLAAIWIGKDQVMVWADLLQHHVSWQEALRQGYIYDEGHEVTWPQDDDGGSLRIRALGEDGQLLEPGSADYEIVRCQILRLWPTRDDLLRHILRRGMTAEGRWEGDLHLEGPVSAATAEVLATLTSIGGDACLAWCTADLPALVSIGGDAYLAWRTVDLPALASIGGDAYLDGCTADLPALASIGGDDYLGWCPVDLSVLASIGGDAELSGYSRDLPALANIGGKAYPWDCCPTLRARIEALLAKRGRHD